MTDNKPSEPPPSMMEYRFELIDEALAAQKVKLRVLFHVVTAAFAIPTIAMNYLIFRPTNIWLAAFLLFLPLYLATVVSKRVVKWYEASIAFNAMRNFAYIASATDPAFGLRWLYNANRVTAPYIHKFITDANFATQELTHAEDLLHAVGMEWAAVEPEETPEDPTAEV